MKKALNFLIITVLCLSLVSCGGSSENADPPKSETSNNSIEVDENLLTVDITLPASMFEDEDMTDFDPDEYTKENGFTNAVVNDDGSVTITMTKAKHKEVMAEMRSEIEKSFQEIIEDPELSYVHDIIPDNKFNTVTIEVDRAEYEKAWFDITPFSVGIQAMLYQTFAGDEIRCEVITEDKDTGEILSSVVYPDAFQNEE
ncbi:MAG: hypothetical protein ACOX4J_05435 [Anaerovoracaceae bacterium]